MSFDSNSDNNNHQKMPSAFNYQFSTPQQQGNGGGNIGMGQPLPNPYPYHFPLPGLPIPSHIQNQFGGMNANGMPQQNMNQPQQPQGGGYYGPPGPRELTPDHEIEQTLPASLSMTFPNSTIPAQPASQKQPKQVNSTKDPKTGAQNKRAAKDSADDAESRGGKKARAASAVESNGATGGRKGRTPGGQMYSQEEMVQVVAVVKKWVPIRQNGWAGAANEYSEWAAKEESLSELYRISPPELPHLTPPSPPPQYVIPTISAPQ
ncbi:hypothetical protein V5O48_015254 [Marasmius crinis-equi]|uniref:Uncharacterized protein n=1 Tax=Marasmius crinis-equi TaxID=585013 RepID=A0ABR3EV20_9AGAR